MEASILDLRRRMADILRALDRNETVKILYRGRQRALLVPTGQEDGPRRPVSSLPAFGIWKDHDQLQDVAVHVRRLRKGRFSAV
jgi:antitoxin (DNA-binding transcriptional repressor) of toxin-antitoxin stability system